MVSLIPAMVSTTILLACRGTDSLTTPSDTTPEASAQVVTDACDKTMTTDYFDLYVRTEGKFENTPEPDESFEMKFSVADDDFQFEFRGNMLRGAVHDEGKFVDGVGYFKRQDTSWYLSKSINTRYLRRFFAITNADGDWSVCPDTSKVEKVGTEVVDGVELTVYKIEYDFNAAAEPEKYILHVRTDFHLDATGQLVRIRDVESHPATDDGGPGTITKTTTISGIGEENTITAPAIP